jgi:D-alanine-D-alanine ligase
MENLIRQSDLPVLMLSNVDHRWSLDEIRESISLTDNLVSALQAIGHPVSSICVETDNLPDLLRPYYPDELIVFNWCEELPGIPHSGASVAQELERRGFTYTGADSYALALSQDKRRVKRLLQKRGIPTPAWQVFTSATTADWTCFPAIVKPAFEHCSFGITREAVVQSTAELMQRVLYVLEELQQPALVEDFIDSREFHVGVIGNGVLHVLPPAEIDYSSFADIHDRLCTYEANFDKTSLAYQFTVPGLPAILTYDQLYSLEEVVTAAYRATGCRDYARMDIRLRDGIFYVLDINHNADISPDTSLVLTAELAGYSYGQFGSLLVNLAAQRHARFACENVISIEHGIFLLHAQPKDPMPFGRKSK